MQSNKDPITGSQGRKAGCLCWWVGRRALLWQTRDRRVLRLSPTEIEIKANGDKGST